MITENKVIVGIAVATVGILLGIAFLFGSKGGETTSKSTQTQVDTTVLTNNSIHKIEGDSKVTIVEFADFQCPACGRTYPVIKQLLEEYKGRVSFIYRNFPLPQHNNAIPAARAAEAAGAQGKYWEMYSLLFSKQNEWSDIRNAQDIFKEYAKSLQLAEEQFTKDMADQKYVDSIEKDKADALKSGVNATPTIYINGTKVTDTSYQGLKNKIEEELKK